MLFYEKGTRVIRHYAEANNTNIRNYDKSIKSTYILNIDFNNMCGYALSQSLPYAGLDFVEYLSVFTFDFTMNYDKESDIGYTLMVDITIHYTYNHHTEIYRF